MLLRIVLEAPFLTRSLPAPVDRVKSSSLYVMAFSLALLPPAAWLGSDSVRRNVVTTCPFCESISQHEERDWCFWGMRGRSDSEPVIQPSRVVQDFPEFQCEHQWTVVSSEVAQWRDGPLFEVRPREKTVDFMPAGSASGAETYNQYLEVRNFIQDALVDEAFSREQFLRWLELDRNMPTQEEWLERDEGDLAAFGKIYGIVGAVTGRRGPNPYRWIESLPPGPPFDVLPDAP